MRAGGDELSMNHRQLILRSKLPRTPLPDGLVSGARARERYTSVNSTSVSLVTRAQKRNSEDWVFWDSRIRVGPETPSPPTPMIALRIR
jgi:hypothetical protein